MTMIVIVSLGRKVNGLLRQSLPLPLPQQATTLQRPEKSRAPVLNPFTVI
ncbi:hypothetical protein Hanom_Chr17g01548201 [Helianthus anomalus]